MTCLGHWRDDLANQNRMEHEHCRRRTRAPGKQVELVESGRMRGRRIAASRRN